MRALQELMGHRNLETTLIYADYAPSGQELSWAEAAFKCVEVGARGQPTAGMPSRMSIEGLARTTSTSGSAPSSTSPHGVP